LFVHRDITDELLNNHAVIMPVDFSPEKNLNKPVQQRFFQLTGPLEESGSIVAAVYFGDIANPVRHRAGKAAETS